MSDHKFTKISPSRIRLSSDDANLPVEFFASESLLPNDETIKKLLQLSIDQRLGHHIAALSEAYAKSHTPNPTGSVVTSEKFILPQMLDTAPNCGMRLVLTDLSSDEASPEQLKKLFAELKKTIPTGAIFGETVSKELMMDTLRYGSAPIAEQYKIRTENEIEHTFQKGSLFPANTVPSRRDVRDAIPALLLEMGRRRLGILGATRTHYVYAVKISDIVDSTKAAALGINPNQIAFFMHSGSGVLGQYVMRLYTPKKSDAIAKTIMTTARLTFDSQLIKYHQQIKQDLDRAKKTGELVSWKDDTYQAMLYLTAHHATSNYGFANRTLLTHALDQTLESVLGRQVKLNLLYDMPHVFVSREQHFETDNWVYRNGATRAMGPNDMKNDPVFAQTGEPVFVAPFPGTHGYIGTGTDQNTDTYFSANHELGKLTGIRLEEIQGDPGRVLSFPAVTSAKSFPVPSIDPRLPLYAEAVIRQMAENKIMNLVARFEPLALLTY